LAMSPDVVKSVFFADSDYPSRDADAFMKAATARTSTTGLFTLLCDTKTMTPDDKCNIVALLKKVYGGSADSSGTDGKETADSRKIVEARLEALEMAPKEGEEGGDIAAPVFASIVDPLHLGVVTPTEVQKVFFSKNIKRLRAIDLVIQGARNEKGELGDEATSAATATTEVLPKTAGTFKYIEPMLGLLASAVRNGVIDEILEKFPDKPRSLLVPEPAREIAQKVMNEIQGLSDSQQMTDLDDLDSRADSFMSERTMLLAMELWDDDKHDPLSARRVLKRMVDAMDKASVQVVDQYILSCVSMVKSFVPTEFRSTVSSYDPSVSTLVDLPRWTMESLIFSIYAIPDIWPLIDVLLSML